jgi:aminoglycoside/choline kinase family phosphotransferase
MKIHQELAALFAAHFKEQAEEIKLLKPHASQRKIFRITSQNYSAIGVENTDVKENQSFIYLSKHFRGRSLPVPEIYAADKSGKFYIQEDLGDTTLYDFLVSKRSDKNPFPREVEHFYSEAVKMLPRFQIEASGDIDYSKTSSFKEFSPENMLADMEYFRVEYLDRTGFKYDTKLLAKEFKDFSAYFSGIKTDYFMYRDFQSRNIMIRDEKLFFIDYQSGCKGALQYDVASLLFQAQARIPGDARDRLLGAYLKALLASVKIDRHQFLNYFYAFVILRIMQVLGTYGLRGLKEQKQYFIDSIDLALSNLRYIYRTQGLPVKMPEFEKFINGLNVKEEKLTINIYSFSYKLSLDIPFDQHGGGFVFDSRCLPNPGREDKYKKKSGLDKEVIDYLESQSSVQQYYKNITLIIDQAVEAYLQRKFLNLSVAFGCTGGQHRSVYLTEKLAEHIKAKFDVKVLTHHLTRELWVR